jgi:hypothetical protein
MLQSPIVQPRHFGSLHLLCRRVKLLEPTAKPRDGAVVLGEARFAQQHFVVPYGHVALELSDEAFEDDFGDASGHAAAENNLGSGVRVVVCVELKAVWEQTFEVICRRGSMGVTVSMMTTTPAASDLFRLVTR